MSWKTIEFWEIFDPKMASFFHVKTINTIVLKIFQTKIKFPEGLEYWQCAITRGFENFLKLIRSQGQKTKKWHINI